MTTLYYLQAAKNDPPPIPNITNLDYHRNNVKIKEPRNQSRLQRKQNLIGWVTS